MTFSETQHQHPSEPVPASREAGRGAHAVAGLLRHAEPAPAGGARAAAGAARRQPAHAAHARGALAGAPRAARPAPGARSPARHGPRLLPVADRTYYYYCYYLNYQGGSSKRLMVPVSRHCLIKYS